VALVHMVLVGHGWAGGGVELDTIASVPRWVYALGRCWRRLEEVGLAGLPGHGERRSS
jgi:hypothetical protein